eukprot:1909658-Prymnesium_polylepis.1
MWMPPLGSHNPPLPRIARRHPPATVRACGYSPASCALLTCADCRTPVATGATLPPIPAAEEGRPHDGPR